MEKVMVYGAVVVVIAIALVAVLALGGNGAKTSSTTSSVSSTVAQRTNNSGILFSSQAYSNYAYLIAPGNASQQARVALDGYNMTVSQQANGTESIGLSVVGAGRTETFVLTAGEKLYVVESSFGDDGPGYDGSLADDGFAVVDQNGYVVKTFTV